ncbi:MAG: flagellar biosynthesis protein FlhB [Bdellovibrionales bacterium]
MAEEQQDKEQKTEEPSTRRLEEARKEGQVPISSEVRTWFMLCGGFLAIALAGPMLGQHMLDALKVYFALPDQLLAADGGLRAALTDTFMRLAPGVALATAILVVAALAGTMVQTGFFAATALLQPKLERISPFAGWKRIFSKQSFAELIKGIIKITLVGVVMYKILTPMLEQSSLLTGMAPELQLKVIYITSLKMLGAAIIMVTFFALLDYAYQRYKFMQQVRMTRHEVKEELKQTEGDPIARARLRQIRLERARRRMMAKVPDADVVITNPTHFAVALEYKVGKMHAPRVLAKGQDMIALKIREVAAENDVPLVENPPLARALHKSCDIDEEIPVEHYQAVAEVISYVYRLKNKAFGHS